MKKTVPKHLLILLLFLLQAPYLVSQCTAGWNAATINWENLDYLTRNGTYTTFVTNQMRDTQYFAIGRNRLKIQLNAITTNGENTTNTAETGSYGSNADVEYANTGSIVFTFDTVVKNLQFSLYDIDAGQRATVTATDAGGNPLIINMVRLATGIITVTGNNTNTAVATANGTAALNTSLSGTVNIDIAGGSNGVQSVTIALSNTAGNFWLSDITACVYGDFPLDYYLSQKPFANQPGYYLVTPDNNSVYLFNPLTGKADWLFSEPESPWVNSMAYDHVNKILYYVRDNPTPIATNKMLKKYDFNTETIGVVVNDITTLGIPVFDIVVESAGAAFYNGSLFLGVEGTKRSGTGAYQTNRESIIWRIDFDAAQNPVKVCQVFARPADNGSGTLTHDWGDFTIKDGVLYDFNTGNVGSTSQFVHFNMQTGSSVNYNTNGNPAPIQVGQTWNGNLYWTGGQGGSEDGRVAIYNENGTIGTKTVVTTTVCSPAWVDHAGDASDPFKPKSDFGDAPLSYDPAGIDPATHEYDCNLRLGPTYDREWDKTPSATATADGTDEDGITTVSILSPGIVNYVQDIQVYNNTTSNATVVAWLDYNGNGVFDPGEGRSVTVPTNASTQTITLSWPGINVGLPVGSSTFLRVRLTTASGLSVNTPNTWFANGEVEDYVVFVNAILPVQLTSFTAQNENHNRVLLNWTTANEINFKGFDIERSSDGNSWHKIAFVPGNTGSKASNTYNYYDNNPLIGKSYYRLKLIDMSDIYEYSLVVSVNIEQTNMGIKVLPNPVNRVATIQFGGKANELVNIYMVNAEGRKVMSRQVISRQGPNQVVLDIPATFTSGVYIIQVVTPVNSMNVKVLIQRK